MEREDAISQTEIRNQFVERIAESVGSHASVRAVFGEPVQREDVTVIPVARMRYGFGGGLGTKEGKQKETEAGRPQQGLGGGGGARIAPVGYISVTGTGAEFREIRDQDAESRRMMAMWLGAGVSAWLVLRGLRGFLGRKRA